MHQNEKPNDIIKEGDKNTKTITDKSIGVTGKGFGVLPRKYFPFPDDKFGLWTDKKNLHW